MGEQFAKGTLNMDNLLGFYRDFFVDGKANLLKLTCDDFIKAVRKYLDTSEIESLIEGNFKDDLTDYEKKILILRFRHAPWYFRSITDKNLRGEEASYFDKDQIVAWLKQCACEQQRDCSEMQKRLESEIYPEAAEELEKLRKKAEEEKKKKTNKGVEAEKTVDKKKVEKQILENFYKELLYARNTSANINVSDCIRKFIVKYIPEKKFDAVRRGYARWCKSHPIAIPIPKGKWPTREFIKFFSLTCVYVQDLQDDAQNLQSAILLKNSEPQTRLFWTDTINFRREKRSDMQQYEDFLETEKMFSRNQNLVDKTRFMKDLVRRGNAYAKAWLLKEAQVPNSKIQERYAIQLALQDHENYRLERGWSLAFRLPPFIPLHSAGKGIALADRELDDNQHGILPSTLVKSLEVGVDVKNRLVRDFCSQYKSMDMPFGTGFKIFIVPTPSMYELDEIMRFQDDLQELTFCFATGQKLTLTKWPIGNPVELKPETVRALHEISSYLASFSGLPHEVKFSIDDLQMKIKAELKYSENAAKINQIPRSSIK